MKNIADFEPFLTAEVDLNQSRIDDLVQRVGSVTDFLRKSDWGPFIVNTSPQGSWAHKTIIKPPGDRGFDADLLVFLRPITGWSAADYLLNLKGLFVSSGIYKDMAGLSTRCVTLQYANDFTLDVVPCIVDRPGGTQRFEVCNRSDVTFEPTDGPGFSNWLSERNEWAGNNQLRKVVRLVKYLRDIKLTFSCKSVLLTTLLGSQVSAVDLYQRHLFCDLPTSLRTLIGRLDAYLQSRPQLPDVRNPVLATESFIRHWDADKYATFREMIHTYRTWIDDAYDEPDPVKSQDKWQRVFGDEFGGGKRALVATLTESQVSGAAIGIPNVDAVQAVKQWGAAVLSAVKQRLPWVKTPPWRMSLAQQVVVRATAHNGKGGPQISAIVSGQVLRPELNLRFEAFALTGQSYGSSAKLYDVQWQVVNTDAVARNVGGLRGGFEKSDGPGVRWELTRYHGIHWIQAFLIRKRDRACVGQSDRFFVVVE